MCYKEATITAVLSGLRMFLALKRIKRHMINEKRAGRYLAYAGGEILLVVIGILIAIQIDSWNQGRIENAELEGYLQSIAENMRADLDKLDSQRRHQERIFTAVNRMLLSIDKKETFDQKDFVLFGSAMRLTWSRRPFSLDTSGYESLKNSGYLSKLHGDDIERLLYDYYDESSQVGMNDRNTYLSKLLYEFSTTNWNIGAAQLYGTKPLTDQKVIDELQPNYKNLFSSPVVTSILASQRVDTPTLLHNWYRQSVMASYFIKLIETNERNFTDEMQTTLNELQIEESDIGDPDVYVDGVLAPFFDIGVASSNGVTNWLSADKVQLNIDYPANQTWGSVFLFVSTSGLTEKSTKDYSTYRKIVLELKGAKGNEQLEFGLKDNEDPDDGSEKRVPLTLDSQWQQYEFELSDFSTADLGDLFTVALFAFEGEEPASISVRKIQFAD